MANYKKRKVRQSRSTCMLCKPNKNSHVKTAERMHDRKIAFLIEERAY